MILPGRGVGKIRFLAAVFILMTAAFSLYARGSKEDSTLSRADEYINQKEYDLAIQLLTDYQRDNPDRFDDAQKRLQKIFKLREQFNQIADELLDTIENDPEDDQKILELSDKLLTIESPSNPEIRRFLDQIRFLAVFNVNKKRLDRIILAAREQLRQNNYAGALDTYASGLDIYQRDYFTSGYGQEAETVATLGLQTINTNIQRFKALVNPFNAAARTMAEYCGSSSPSANGAASMYSRLAPNLGEMDILNKRFFDTRVSFDTQLETLQREQNVLGDTSFLSFAGRLISGPSGQGEGMSGTVDKYWRYLIDPVDAALMNCINNSYSSGLTDIVNWEFAKGILIFDETDHYIATASELVKSWSSFLGNSGGIVYPVMEETVSEEKIGDFLKFLSLKKTMALLREAGNIGMRSNAVETGGSTALSAWQQGTMTAQAAISREQTIRGLYQVLTSELNILEGKIGSEFNTMSTYQEMFDNVRGVGLPQSYINDAQNVAANMNFRLKFFELNSIVRMYTVANGDLENRTNAREREFNRGNSLIQGISEVREGEAYLARYPTEGLELLTQMNQSLSADIAAAGALISQYDAESWEVLGEDDVNVLYIAARALRDRLLSMQNRSNGLMATARTQRDLAAARRSEGDRFYQAAQAALSRNDPDAASTNVDRATGLYSESLAIQESSSLRATWTDQLMKLGAEIAVLQNERVVRDVRNYLNTAIASYQNGNLEQAENALVNAQNRWHTTNITDHPEVSNWLILVRGAMSINSGRTIHPTAPLFAEMSQLLSDASSRYNEGLRLISSGRQQEGIARFNEALAKTREVRLIFPLNHDARMLALRIEQQTNLPVFNATFRQRLDEAVAGTRARNLEAFADLLDLAEINPGYPGIQNLVREAEYTMGTRQRPPNPADLARSTQLTRDAQAVINAQNSLRYEAAEGWLREAVTLNPNNEQAQSLADQISILIRGEGTIVLPPYARAQFDLATQEVLRGNYIMAYQIVQQLLLNPAYQRSVQIQRLKERIEQLL